MNELLKYIDLKHWKMFIIFKHRDIVIDIYAQLFIIFI